MNHPFARIPRWLRPTNPPLQERREGTDCLLRAPSKSSDASRRSADSRRYLELMHDYAFTLEQAWPFQRSGSQSSTWRRRPQSFSIATAFLAVVWSGAYSPQMASETLFRPLRPNAAWPEQSGFGSGNNSCG